MKSYLNEVVAKRKPAGTVKSWLMKLVFSRIGPVVTGLISTVIGFAMSFLTSKLSLIGVSVPADMQMEIAGFLSFTVYGSITFLINKYAGDSAAAMQEALAKASGMKLEVDRWIDLKTIDLATKINYTPKATPVND